MENIKILLAESGFTVILAAKTFGNVNFKDYRQPIQLVL
jgi:hypothetical protein